MPKSTTQAEVILNSEKIKPIALVIAELHLTEGISQSVENSKFLCIDLIKEFWVDL